MLSDDPHIRERAVYEEIAIRDMKNAFNRDMESLSEIAENIDLERAEEALKRANEYMTTSPQIQDVEYAAMQGRIEKELARVNVALKYMKMRKNRVTIKTGS